MKFISTLMILMIAVTATIGMSASALASVQVAEAIGSVGRVEVVKPNSVRGSSVNIGDTISAGDMLRTSSGSSATLRLVDGSVIDIGASSRVKFQELVPESSSHVELEKGDILFEITPITPVRGSFKVKTTTSIIGVKGTNFRVISSASSTKVTMNRGTVGISSVTSPNREVSVSAGSVAIVSSSGVQVRRQTQSEQSLSFSDIQISETSQTTNLLEGANAVAVEDDLSDTTPSPDPTTPDPTTPDPTTPDPTTPDPVTPDPVTPDPITPEPVEPPPVVTPPVVEPDKPDPVTPSPDLNNPEVTIIVR